MLFWLHPASIKIHHHRQRADFTSAPSLNGLDVLDPGLDYRLDVSSRLEAGRFIGLISHHRRSAIAQQSDMLNPTLDYCLNGQDVLNPGLDHHLDVPHYLDGHRQQAHDR